MKVQSYRLLVEGVFTVMFEQFNFLIGNLVSIDFNGGQLLLSESGYNLLLSKQEFLFEIWLSSSISGAVHFFFDSDYGVWLSKSDFSVELFGFVEFEVSLMSGFLIILVKVV